MDFVELFFNTSGNYDDTVDIIDACYTYNLIAR